jgi:shikimate kinase
VEPDFSSMFSLAATAAAAGEAVFEGIPASSLQPDFRGFELLESMGAGVARSTGLIRVTAPAELRALDADLGDCPDLAPVLATLCAFARGTSVLRGAAQLRFKESDRISSTASLLAKMGVGVRSREDGLEIDGDPALAPRSFVFDPDDDHRLAMAAGLLIARGWPVQVIHPEVVNKSFPEYWRALRAGPHLIVGHRGTGKTSFLRRLASAHARDLDAELERENSQSVFEIMKNRGEEVCRLMEVALAKRVLETASPQSWLASGAGLRLDDVQPGVDVLWVRRDTDRDGRVFLDRPRLDPQTDPLAEFRERAKRREGLYGKWATREYTMPEGLSGPEALEERIVRGDLGGTGGAVTLTPRHRRNLMQLGADRYELRDDLLDADEIRAHFGKIPEERILYSVRKSKTLPSEAQDGSCWIDWGLEAGYPEREDVVRWADRLILSSHGTLKEALLDFRLFSKHQVRLKLSPWIESFEDLKAGHLWWSQDPERRAFLPRSAEGRWSWYRLWMKGRAFLNFWREGLGSAPDQPTLWHWLATPDRPERFAAVLGSPVHHSWTPVEHREFFASTGLPVWAIDVREGEWSKAFPFLEELGLRFAAVTSPLKGRAFRASTPTARAAELGSVNTLAWHRDGEWKGDNTDLAGLKEAAADLPEGSVAIWGGGGTLPVVGKIWPGASAYSSRAGHVRQGSSPLPGSPTVVVWAAPRSADLIWPPSDWKPAVVFDLNYKEDSPGREYALKIGAAYRSGEAMFRAQARAQREFWADFLKEKK